MTVRRFAEGTTVDVAKTKAELEALLVKHGAVGCSVSSNYLERVAQVGFKLGERFYRLQVAIDASGLPNAKQPSHHQQATCPRGWSQWTVGRRQEWIADQLAQSEREQWRRLLLVVKAKLELVADGGSTVEREFLADMMLPGGRTVSETLQPQIADAYAHGKPIALLPSRT